VRTYLRALPEYGIHAERAILYGSFANGNPHAWSDIDLIVLAPEFDKPYTIEFVKRLWHAKAKADKRIEPVACGEREWETDTGRLVVEVARREGIEIAA